MTTLKDLDDRPYRLNVGVLLFNEKGHVFVGERSDSPGAWQMPQGGIDEGEDWEIAAYRELEEETGILKDKAEIIRVMDDYLTYDFPPELSGRAIYRDYKGQQQKWVAMRFTGENSDINITGHHEIEFSRWQWVTLKDTLDLIVPFKHKVYEALIKEFSDIAVQYHHN